MSKSVRRAGIITAVLALACGLLPLPTAIAGDEGERIEIRKIVRCDGDDCSEEIHERGGHGPAAPKVILIGDHHHGMHHLARLGGGTYLGVQLSELTTELRRHFGVPEEAGVMVSRVMEDSPAARAGIAVGDIIGAVDGEAVASGPELAKRIRGREAGDVVDLEIWRGGRLETLAATLEAREGARRAERRRIVVECEEGEACDHELDFDCGGAEECEVRVECRDGACECTVNGEATDCGEIPGVPSG